MVNVKKLGEVYIEAENLIIAEQFVYDDYQEYLYDIEHASNEEISNLNHNILQEITQLPDIRQNLNKYIMKLKKMMNVPLNLTIAETLDAASILLHPHLNHDDIVIPGVTD